MPATRFTSQFHAEIEGGPWTSIAIWPNDDPYGPINGVIFEVGEPVRVCEGAFPLVSSEEKKILAKRVFWIMEFAETMNGHSVNLGATRTYFEQQVNVGRLIKLEPLHRLAAEGSDGPDTI